MAVPSKITGTPTPRLLRCANWRDQGSACENTSAVPCEKCNLVMYCSPACKGGHGEVHQLDCDHGLASGDWVARWCAESREPHFLKDPESIHPFSRRFPRIVYSWGNLPAMDLVRAGSNEGMTTERHLKILSVETDIRHGVKTIAKLPETFGGKVTLTYTNGNMDMLVRNVLLVMVANFVPDKSDAVDCMIHLWYSAYLRPSHVQALCEFVLPCIQQAVQMSHDHPDKNAICTRSWVHEDRGVSVALSADQWKMLLGCFAFAMEDDEINPQSVIARDEVTASDAYQDERDLVLLRNPPHRRVAIMKFWEDGVLQPFGDDCSEFKIPNPLLFRAGNWVMEELADPFDGWDFPTVMSGAQHMPESDMYGRLFCHLHELFSEFVEKTRDHAVTFEMHHVAPENIRNLLDEDKFARIDITAVTEHPGFNPEEVYKTLGDLLELPEDNPHATIIAMFVKSVEEELVKHEDLGPKMAHRHVVGRLLGLDLEAMDDLYSEDMVRCHDALPLVLDLDEAFSRWKETSGILEHLSDNNLQLKTSHSIVKEWPTRVELEESLTMENLTESFSLAMASPHGGHERLVEIQRVAKKPVDDSK